MTFYPFKIVANISLQKVSLEKNRLW